MTATVRLTQGATQRVSAFLSALKRRPPLIDDAATFRSSAAPMSGFCAQAGNTENNIASFAADTPHETVTALPPVSDPAPMDAIRIELGYGLLGLAGGVSPRLIDDIKQMRRSIAFEMDFLLPKVRIQDNMALPAETYSLLINEIELGRGVLRPDMVLAVAAPGRTIELQGEPLTHAAEGLSAMWIEERLHAKATADGYEVFDPSTILTTHLTELVRQSISALRAFVATHKRLEDFAGAQQSMPPQLLPS